jgi:hypothetical protein
MYPLLKEIHRNPVLWLWAFMPAVFVAQQVNPEAHTLLFVLGTRLDPDRVEFCEMRHRMGRGMTLVRRRAGLIPASVFQEGKGGRNNGPECGEL